jgi:hypothetical protein
MQQVTIIRRGRNAIFSLRDEDFAPSRSIPQAPLTTYYFRDLHRRGVVDEAEERLLAADKISK